MKGGNTAMRKWKRTFLQWTLFSDWKMPNLFLKIGRFTKFDVVVGVVTGTGTAIACLKLKRNIDWKGNVFELWKMCSDYNCQKPQKWTLEIIHVFHILTKSNLLSKKPWTLNFHRIFSSLLVFLPILFCHSMMYWNALKDINSCLPLCSLRPTSLKFWNDRRFFVQYERFDWIHWKLNKFTPGKSNSDQ